MKESVIEKIIAFLFGRKYYANIVNTRGTDKMEMSSFIHRSREAADKHRIDIMSTRLYDYVETVSFRSRRDY